MKKSKINKVEVDSKLFITILILVAIGVVMVYSASSYIALHNKDFKYDEMYFLKKQGMWALMGIALMIVTQRIDYHKLKVITKPLILITIILLVAVLFFKETNGARRWIRIGGMSLQPSEIAKYVIVFYMAMSIERKGQKMKKFLKGMLPYLLVSGLFAGLVLLEKNLSIATVIMSVTLILLFIGGVNWKQLTGLVASMVPLGLFFIYTQPYRLKRFLNFRDPFKDPKGDGFQLIQSWYALASGGLLGVGLGKSRQKCLYLPEAYNDFIFAIIGEELGLVGSLVIIILFFILICRGLKIAFHAKDTYGTLLAVGITSVIAIQTIINIAVVTGAIPVTGVPLPFISYGGSSLLFNLAAMGVLLNISSQIEKR